MVFGVKVSKDNYIYIYGTWVSRLLTATFIVVFNPHPLLTPIIYILQENANPPVVFFGAYKCQILTYYLVFIFYFFS